MTLLSIRAKEAIKTGLAMVIAFGIALSMGWERPYWAGFAVAFISLPGVGQSLRKGALRMCGTLMAGIASLVIVGLFPQERWLFMVALSVWIGFCAYMMQGRRNQYFWQVGAFVCVIIVFDGGVNSLNLFKTVVERVQETGMGILVYTLISVFLWPQSAKAGLDDVSRKLASAQSQLFRTYREMMTGEEPQADCRPLRLQEGQLAAQFGKALDGAETDSYEVWELRHQWRRLERLSTDFGEALERWRETVPEIQTLDLKTVLPEADVLCSEVEARLEQIELMLAGTAPKRHPIPVKLAFANAEAAGLSHFQRAAVATTKAQLDRLESKSQDLFACVADIKGFGPRTESAPGEETAESRKAIDTERFVGVIRILASMWMAFLIWVYINPPGHQAFVIFPVSIGLAFVLMPWLPVAVAWVPMLVSAAFASVLYVFIMPQLSGYAQLGALIFLATFAIAYLFAEPRQGLARAMGLALFVTLISVQNQQTYSFAGLANQTLMMFLAVALLTVVAYFPTSPRPEKAFLRLLRRFFRQSEVLMSRLSLDWKRERGLAGRLESAFYANDLVGLAQQLEPWGRSIDHREFPDTTPEQVQSLVSSLYALAFRIKELGEARAYPQAELLVRELLDDVRAWRIAVQTYFERWAKDPAMHPDDDLRKQLAAKLANMERRIDEVFERAESDELSDTDLENFYRLLGAYRGLSEALVAHAQLTNQVAWTQWQEARF